MAKRTKTADDPAGPILSPARTRVIYCGDNLEQLTKLPGGSVDLITIDPPFHSNRNDEVFSRRDQGAGTKQVRSAGFSPFRKRPKGRTTNAEVFWGETKEKRAFQDRHESTKATIEFMRPRAVELARVHKKTGSFYDHCDWWCAGTPLSGQHGPASESPLTP